MASDEKPVCRGDWHPRDSSRSVPSRLIERDGQVAAVSGDGADLASATFPALDISPRVGSIPRRIAFPDGSLFETNDNGAIDALQLGHGRKRAGFIHGLERFHPRLLVFVAAVFLLSGLVYRYALPVLVEIAVAVTPPVVPHLMSVSTLQMLDRTVMDDTRLDEANGRRSWMVLPASQPIRAVVRPAIR